MKRISLSSAVSQQCYVLSVINKKRNRSNTGSTYLTELSNVTLVQEMSI